MRFLPKFRPLTAHTPLAIVSIVAVAVVLVTRPAILQAHDGNNEAPRQARTLTLSAIGSIDSKPDMVSINTGIETQAVKARDALDDNNDVMAGMMKSLKAAGLEDRDIATTQFSVQPRYQHFKNGRPSKTIGYRVINSLSLTVRDLDNLGAVLDRLVSLGTNRISGIRFGLKKQAKALDDARQDAMRKVLDKAALYARAAGVTLGPIISISEQTTRNFPRQMEMRSMRASASPVSIAPGQHTTKVTVHVKWSLEK